MEHTGRAQLGLPEHSDDALIDPPAGQVAGLREKKIDRTQLDISAPVGQVDGHQPGQDVESNLCEHDFPILKFLSSVQE